MTEEKVKFILENSDLPNNEYPINEKAFEAIGEAWEKAWEDNLRACGIPLDCVKPPKELVDTINAYDSFIEEIVKAVFILRDLDNFNKHELYEYFKKAGIDITNYNVERIISILCKCGYLKINEVKNAKYGYVYDVVKIFSER